MYRFLEKIAFNSVEKAIKSLEWGDIKDIKFEEPPDRNMGDLATSVAFQLAKRLKKSPVDISKEIKESLILESPFEKVECKGPYINFYLDYEQFSKMVLKGVTESYGTLKDNNTKIILEHTSANPNGPLHIGHIRNAIIGDSLARILKSAGFNVETQYYVNDMGRQIAMIVWGLQNLGYSLDTGEKSDVEIGKLYFNVNQVLKENPDVNNQVSSILKVYEEDNPEELESMFKNVVKMCLEGVKETSKRLHISHDCFVWESQFIRDGSIKKILETLNAHLNQDDVVYLDLTNYGIEKELILTRSDGTTLYTTRDIAYHLQKSEQSDVVVDVLGSDHKLAIDQLKIVMELLGGKKPEVIFYEFITLPEGSMSTRKGVFISVDQLMDEAFNRAKSELENRRPELNESLSDEIAEIIGIGAIRYFIARLSPEKHLVFKWDEALSFERGCASIQYAHARACKLLEKTETKDFLSAQIDDLDFSDLDELEIELLKTIGKFSSIVETSARDFRVHPIAQYAMELAGAFNKFYKSVQVIGSEKEVLRLLMVDKSRITIRNCLNLLGIDAPISM